MTEPVPIRRSWLRETLTLLRACWWRVLAISAVTEVAALLAVGGLVLYFYSESGSRFDPDDPLLVAAVYGVPAVLTGACAAWNWAAVVEVLQGAGEGRRVRIGAALGRGVRRSGRLALWLAGVGLIRAVGSMYLLYTLTDYAHAISTFRTVSSAVATGGWYLSFAVALLPLVVLLERRGPVRAWSLAHTRAATIGQIVAVLAFGWAVAELAQLALTQAYRPELPYAVPAVVQVSLDSIVGVLASTVTMTALMVTFLHRVARSAVPDPAVEDPAPGGPEPVVIELGRTW